MPGGLLLQRIHPQSTFVGVPVARSSSSNSEQKISGLKRRAKEVCVLNSSRPLMLADRGMYVTCGGTSPIYSDTRPWRIELKIKLYPVILVCP